MMRLFQNVNLQPLVQFLQVGKGNFDGPLNAFYGQKLISGAVSHPGCDAPTHEALEGAGLKVP